MNRRDSFRRSMKLPSVRGFYEKNPKFRRRVDRALKGTKGPLIPRPIYLKKEVRGVDEKVLDPRQLTIKFKNDLNIEYISGDLRNVPSEIGPFLTDLKKKGCTWLRRTLPDNVLREMKATAEENSGEEHADLTTMFKLILSDKVDPVEVANRFLEFNCIEYVEFKPKPIPRNTGEVPNLQPHLDFVYETLGIYNMWAEGYHGEGIKLGMIDTYYTPHADLEVELLNVTRPGSHGTGCAGIISAKNNGWGTTGIAYGRDAHYAFNLSTEEWDDAALALSQYLSPGDIIHTSLGVAWGLGGEIEGYLPYYEVSKLLQDSRDLIIVFAAGNDAKDLNLLDGLHKPFHEGRTGSLMVGASTYNVNGRHQKAHYSDYSSGPPGPENAVSLQAPSQILTPLPEGTFYEGPDSSYDYGDPAGTSFACPFIAGCSALLSQAMKAYGLQPDSYTMRSLLYETGIEDEGWSARAPDLFTALDQIKRINLVGTVFDFAYDGTPLEQCNFFVENTDGLGLLPSTEDAMIDEDDIEGVIDQGARYTARELTLQGKLVCDSLEEQDQKLVEIASLFNTTQPKKLISGRHPNRYLLCQLNGEISSEFTPMYNELSIPLIAPDPFWYGDREEQVRISPEDPSLFLDLPGGTYVEYDGELFLKLTGRTTRVFDFTLSEKSSWEPNINWASRAEVIGGVWTNSKRVMDEMYWLNTMHPDYGAPYFVDEEGRATSGFLSWREEIHTRIVRALPFGLEIVSGTGTENDPIVVADNPDPDLSTSIIQASGNYPTPLVLTISGPAINPKIVINGARMEYNGSLGASDRLTIDTSKRTALYNFTNAKGYNRVFPLLNPGENIIQTNCTVQIKWRPRWL